MSKVGLHGGGKKAYLVKGYLWLVNGVRMLKALPFGNAFVHRT